jgi:hypothetical protein
MVFPWNAWFKTNFSVKCNCNRRKELPMAKSKAGGGINSNKRVEKGLQTSKKGSTAVQIGYAGQLGMMKGNHATEGGDIPFAPIKKDQANKPLSAVPFGNSLTTNVGKGGPGTGRRLYPTGAQGQHGAADPGMPQPTRSMTKTGKDILSQFGPEKTRR